MDSPFRSWLCLVAAKQERLRDGSLSGSCRCWPGRAASFGDLPEGCKNLVLDMYQKMWNLSVTNVGFKGI
jgi:hypothetical protein